jgi:hypothetical protein
MPAAVVVSSKLAERLRAHASLCRKLARECWSEEIAVSLCQLADDCTLAAEAAEAEATDASQSTSGKPH